MRLYLRSAAFWAVECATSLARVIRDAWRGPVTTPPVVQSMPRQRDISVDDATIEAAQHEAIVALLRRHGFSPWPTDARDEVIALEALLMAPAAEVDE